MSSENVKDAGPSSMETVWKLARELLDLRLELWKLVYSGTSAEPDADGGNEGKEKVEGEMMVARKRSKEKMFENEGERNGDTDRRQKELEKNIRKVVEQLTKLISTNKQVKSEVNRKNCQGLTLLHLLAAAGETSLVSLLITKGANVTIKDKKYGWIPAQYASFFINLETLRVLYDNNGGKLDAIQESCVEIIKKEIHSILVQKEEIKEKELFTWGKGSNFTLGHGDPDSKNHPKKLKVFNEINVQYVSTNESHTACVCSNGSLWVWGRGVGGKLGLGNEETQSSPCRVNLSKSVKMVSCGVAHTAVVTQGGEVFTFGTGEFGQLGHGEQVTKLFYPKRVHGYLDEKYCTQVSCGRFHTIAVSSNAEVFTWGLGETGALGHGENVYSNQFSPRIVAELTTVKSKKVSAGKSHSLVLTVGGHVYVMGFGKSYPRKFKHQKAKFVHADITSEKSILVSPEGRVIVYSGENKQNSFEIAIDGIVTKAEIYNDRVLALTEQMNLFETTENFKSIQRYDIERVLDFSIAKTHTAAIIGKLSLKHLGENYYNLGRTLAEFVGRDELSDMKLELDTREQIPAHRIVLACQSPVFRKLLADIPPNQVIHVSGCGMNALKIFLTYLYSSQTPFIDCSQTSYSIIGELLELCEKYQVDHLVPLVKKIQKGMDNVKNVHPLEGPAKNFQEGIAWALTLESQHLSDLTVTFEDPTEPPILAHKLILATRSSYFRTMFGSQFMWRETTTETLHVVEIRPKIMKRLITFLYTESIGTKIPVQNVLDLLMAADRYFLEDLRQVCSDQLREHISITNVVELLEFAQLYQAQEIKEYSFIFLGKNLFSFFQNKLIHELDSQILKAMEDFLKMQKNWSITLELKDLSSVESPLTRVESSEILEQPLSENPPANIQESSEELPTNLEFQSSSPPSPKQEKTKKNKKEKKLQSKSNEAISTSPQQEELIKSPPMNVPRKANAWTVQQTSPSKVSLLDIQKDQETQKLAKQFTPPSSKPTKHSPSKPSGRETSSVSPSSISVVTPTNFSVSPSSPSSKPLPSKSKSSSQIGTSDDLSPWAKNSQPQTKDVSVKKIQPKSFLEIQNEEKLVASKPSVRSLREIQHEEQEIKMEMLDQEKLDRAIAESLQLEFEKEEQERLLWEQQQKEGKSRQHGGKNSGGHSSQFNPQSMEGFQPNQNRKMVWQQKKS